MRLRLFFLNNNFNIIKNSLYQSQSKLTKALKGFDTRLEKIRRKL